MHSVDFIGGGNVLLLGLINGAILIYQFESPQLNSINQKASAPMNDVQASAPMNDVQVTNTQIFQHEITGEDGMPVEDLQSDIEETPFIKPVDSILLMPELPVLHQLFSLSCVPVHPGFQPPLPHLMSQETISNVVVRGSLFSESSAGSNSSYFAAAWADGRICICLIADASHQGSYESPGGNSSYWKVLHCVHTGMSLFHMQYVELSVDLDFPLFIAASHCGKIFFVSTKSLYEDNKGVQNIDDHRLQNFDSKHRDDFSLPNTVCCFESDTLINNLQSKRVAEVGVDLHHLMGIKQSLLLRDVGCRK